MNLDLIDYLVIAFGMFVGWVFLSPDEVADKLRVKWLNMKSRVARQLDDAVGEAKRAVATAKANRAKANNRLIEQKNLRNTAKINLDEVNADLLPLEKAADEAAKANRLDLVEQAEKDLEPLRRDQKKFQNMFNTFDSAVKAIEADIALLNEEIAEYEEDLADKEARAAKAGSTKETKAIIADMHENGPRKMMQRSEEILRRVEGEAMTVSDAAKEVTDERSRRDELKRLAGKGEEKLTLEQRVKARMEKFAQTDQK